ncbi:hypothetical protein [Streptomyces sp. NBC_01294]|uniref:hypothetical protein n=1 Tax=Streptomyces sp. NBC_01294 TaxID=2903815 RepID=UPI002DD8DB85|nr:hypothetical protein [Streptomyces sp. NBC_01294]WRZ55244.1 GNAT family N-acetyltransferase [Streptomyces sp. NBC_01294]WRZ61452.1 GNAT family N-acetyltransferase [Streptomyces sp. NBC_01294]
MKAISTGAEVSWHVSAFRLGQEEPGAAELVGLIRELRARTLFDRGRRPDFRTADGAYTDNQDLDFGAWHFIARREAGGRPLGYVRLSTPETGELFQTRAYLGAERYEDVLRAHGLGVAETFEHSRLVVEHQARKLGLGVYLNAFAIAAARCLGAKAMIGTSGTADGQDRFHERFGFHPVPGTRRYVEHYTEDVAIMLYRAAQRSGQYTDLIEGLEGDFPAATVTAQQAGLGAAVEACLLPDTESRRPVGAVAAEAEADGAWRPVLLDLQREHDRDALETSWDRARSARSWTRSTNSRASWSVDAVFTAMDSDDDNQIPLSVLTTMFTRGGLSEDDAAEAARVFDVDGDGTVTHEEYAAPWQQTWPKKPESIFFYLLCTRMPVRPGPSRMLRRMRRTFMPLAVAALALTGCTTEQDKAARYWDGHRFGEQTATDYARRVLDTNFTFCTTGGEVASRQDMCTRPGGVDTRYPASAGRRECADALPDGLGGDEREAWNEGCTTGMSRSASRMS